MTETEVLIRELETLRRAINHDWRDLEQLALTDRERAVIRLHIKFCIQDMAAVIGRMDHEESANQT